MSNSDDKPQFAVISREVGSEFINIYSRHTSRGAADQAVFAAKHRHNRERFTRWFAVVKL